MLTELADYASAHNLSSRPGFKKKNVKGYVYLSAAGSFLGVEAKEKGAQDVYAPDIGSAANGPRFCNPLIEKAQIVFCIIKDEEKDKNILTKHEFFLSMTEDAAKYEPRLNAVLKALRSDDTVAAVIETMTQNKIKDGDPIGFVIDGTPTENMDGCLEWWGEYRKRFKKQAEGLLPRCLITGELSPALETVPKVSGLNFVGGHTSGDAFLCFDKDAFRSYGLEQSANAPVSDEAMTAVNAALSELIKKATVLGGAKLVHWYAGDVPEEMDLFNDMLEGIWGDDDGVSDENEAESDKSNDAEAERAALHQAKQLMESVKSGQRPPELSSRYYIMPLSGAGGRMMVRGWYEGSFESLYTNIDRWFDDLQLINPYGNGWTKPPKLKALCVRLLKPGGDPKKVWSRIDEELSALSAGLVDAIVNDHPLPDDVASRALRYIRSAMLASDNEESSSGKIKTESMAFQLLKAWLVRRQRQRGDKEIMGTDINTSPHTVAYCCGRLMSVYNAIQEEAMPDVNVSIAERYYAAASSTPAFVIGKLAQLSQHHLPKLNGYRPKYYQNMLSEIYTEIGDESIPTTLNQEQQTEFALGYYQQRAAMRAPAAANKEEK